MNTAAAVTPASAPPQAGGISLHGVDVARGVPAEGLQVELWLIEPERRLVAAGALGAKGQLEHASVSGAGIVAGRYEALFHVGDYLRAAVGEGASPFLDVVPFRFTIVQVAQHVHLPFKFTPWGYSLFRGI